MLDHSRFLALFVIPFVVSGTHCLTPAQSDNGLENFLRSKLLEYPAWLRENNLDPSPLLPGPTDVSSGNDIIQLDCFLYHHGVANFSGDHDFIIWFADLEKGAMSFVYYTQPGTRFEGEYVANGTLPSGVTFSGKGRWNISVPSLQNSWLIKFYITPDEHVNIISWKSYFLPWENFSDIEVKFEGLWDTGAASAYEEEIKSLILQSTYEYLRTSMDHPYRANFMTFFTKDFTKSLKSVTQKSTKPMRRRQ